MTAAVVLTGNHWWLDVFGAMALVGAVIALDAPIQRWLEGRGKGRAGDPDPADGSDPADDEPVLVG